MDGWTEAWREDQEKYLIHFPPKQLGPIIGVREETISRWRQGAWPIPNFRAGQLAEIQRNLVFLRRSLGRYGLIVLARPRPGLAHDPILLLANFAATSTRVLELIIAKRQRGELLTEEEAAEANRMLDEGAADIEALREMVKEQTKKEPKP